MTTLSNAPPIERLPAQLTGLRPRLVQRTWLLYLMVATALLPFRAIVTYRDYATVCTAKPCPEYQLDAAGLASLAGWGISPQNYAAIGVAQMVLLAATLFALAGLLVWKRPDERMPVFLAFVFVALGVTFFGNDAWPVYPAWRRPEQTFWFIQTAALVPLFCLFPDGRFPNRWLKWIALATIPPNLISFSTNPPSPDSLISTLFGLFALFSFLTVIVALIYRYRSVAMPAQRRQMKWVLYGTALNMGALIITGVMETWLFPAAGRGTPLGFVLEAIRFAAIIFNFTCFAIALLRYRLFDIDLLINRTLVYSLLTGLIISLYSSMVGGFGFFMQGEQGQAAALVAATGLTLAAIQPAYRKAQGLANRLAPVVSQPDRKPEPPDDQSVALPGHYRQLARGLYLIAVTISLGWFAVNIPFAFQQAQMAGARAQTGVPPTLYALYTVGLDALFVALCAAVSLTIFRHKSNETITLLTAGTLVVWGIFNGLILQSNQALGAPEEMGGLLGLVGGALVFAGYMGWMLFFYLFPSGRFVPRWTRFTAIAWLLFSGSWILWPESPLTPNQWPPWLFGPVVLSLWASFAMAQIYRYRRVSGPEQKQQTKWVIYGVSVVAVGFVPSVLLLGTVFEVPLADVGRHMLTQFLSIGFISLIPLTIGVAILRHRLFDIDLLINRTLVYGTLTLLVIGLYVLVVGYLGALFRTEANLLISLVTTGLVAVLFQPARERLQRGVNRLMFGQRDDPVGMLAHLAHRLETVNAPQSILPTLVETIAAALKLPYVALQTEQTGGQLKPVAEAGRPTGQAKRLPLLYQQQQIGQLLLAPRSPGERFSQADERLLATIAPIVATTLRAVQLSEALQASRREIVTGREEERRRLRRDLHDGLGPVLASVALQADTASELVDADPTETKQLLAAIANEAQTAVADIRYLIYGLRPPALDELGLVKALRQTSRSHQMQVTVEASRALPLLPAAVEVAVYRMAQEAINNAIRHGQAKNCRIMLAVDDQELHLTVTDDGLGLPENAPAGIGLISMRERVAELGGTFTIQSLPAGGTQLKACLPLD